MGQGLTTTVKTAGLNLSNHFFALGLIQNIM